MLKSWMFIKHYRQICLVMLFLLLSACQTSNLPDSAVPTPEPSTETPVPTQVTSTPTDAPVDEPPSPTPTPTAEITAGQVTPGVTPAEEENRVGWVKTDTAVLRTVDGGASWQDVTPGGIKEFLSSTNDSGSAGFAAAFSGQDYGLLAYAEGEKAIIYRTSNGGQSWQEAILELQEEVQGITSMVLLGETHGWLLATRGIGAGNDWVDLYYSMDAGASWNFLAGSESEINPGGGISSGGIKSGLSFNSPERGWLTGSAPIDMVYLFRTLDGGLSWQPYHLPLPESASFSGTTYPPIFFDEQNGILPATLISLSNEPGLLFYETRDAGENWVPTILLEGDISAWDWIDSQHGFAAGSDSQSQSKVYVTRDGGKSWEAYPVKMEMVRTLDFITERVGWAICGWAFEPRQGCSGDLYRTEDSGRSWDKVYP
jgi:photosystem II stability/assembly factor-like uncharacterized protein